MADLVVELPVQVVLEAQKEPILGVTAETAVLQQRQLLAMAAAVAAALAATLVMVGSVVQVEILVAQTKVRLGATVLVVALAAAAVVSLVFPHH